MSNMHHENKSARVFIFDWVAAIPLVPLGIFPSVDRVQAYLVFLVIMGILGLLKIRTSTLLLKLLNKAKGKTFFARSKNNR